MSANRGGAAGQPGGAGQGRAAWWGGTGQGGAGRQKSQNSAYFVDVCFLLCPCEQSINNKQISSFPSSVEIS